MANLPFILFSFFLISCNAIPATKTRTCGYKGCPTTRDGMINVHLVPHTHDDVGWLKTLDQYYYGSRNGIQRAGVQYILDSVVQALLQDPERRFIFVESEFFFKWWDEQTPELQEEVRVLVNEGRLEFAGGAWSMNDEATVHYQSVIDQFSIGLKKLKETFGECGRPKIGWQIDPFGHSREMASLFAQMGYDGQFFARLDWVDKSTRMSNKTAEMIWHGSPTNLGSSSDLFTGALYNHYSAPPGFCFDTLCQDEPIVDSKRKDIRNVDSKVKAFIDYINNLSTKYRTNNVMVPMGDDFNYQEANINFKNMDKLIKYVNEMQIKNGSNINVFYSTPACYLKSLNDAKITWPEKNEDFFPYSTDPHTYWTGYYTSRPTIKRFEREGNHFLQVCKQLSVLADLFSKKPEFSNNLEQLKDIMGVMQHHDAVTGTEKQHVSDDYEKLLTDGMVACEENAKAALQTLTKYENADFQSCFALNISSCGISENMSKFVVTLFNPLSKVDKQIVRIPVREGSYEVIDSNGNLIDSQVVQIPSSLEELSFRKSSSSHELVFVASVTKLDSFVVKRKTNYLEEKESESPKEKFVLKNSKVHLEFDESGRLVLVRANGVEVPVKQDLLFYNGAAGNNAIFANRSSGAYIFRPNGTLQYLGGSIELNVFEGSIVKEVHQKFNDWISQVIRIYEDKSYVEFEWLVGPIPVEDNVGKEVISKFSSNIKSDKIFYTDSNGRDMMKRVRFSREDFEALYNETESSNYYPVTASIALEDSKIRMAVLNDRAQGGSSLSDGSLELMVHRRLLRDDAFGVGEALNETHYGKGLIAKGKHYLLIGPNTKQTKINERKLQLEILLPHWKFFSSESVSGPKSDVNKLFSALSSFPDNVNILTLEPWNDNEVLLRLENILEKPEGSNVVVNIQKLCKQLRALEIRETTLDGNMWLSDMKRLRFTEDNGVIDTTLQRSPFTPFFATSASPFEGFDITLSPMSIRTFVLKIENLS
ncbi:MAN2B1.2 family protein [Megaselia abdita]